MRPLVLLALAAGLAACEPQAELVPPEGSPGTTTYYPTGFDPMKDPYWEDPRWEKTLLDTLQAAVHDPEDRGDLSAPGFHATLKLTFDAGMIEYPEIVSSTGDPHLDVLMLHQVALVQIPLPTAGLQTDQPHEFELDLDMPTPLETFESTIYSAINYQKVYPKDPIISGTTGESTVSFTYQNGRSSDIALTTSSKSWELDRSSIAAVTKAIMPAAPAAYAGKALQLEVTICYTLESWKNGTFLGKADMCPTARNVIDVIGTRMVRTEVRSYP
jgi:hypothetical protein